jgi:hypothetical protein
MPNLDGHGLVQALHAQGFDPPLLLLTGTDRNPGHVARMIGANAGLSKFDDVEAVLEAVEQLRVP